MYAKFTIFAAISLSLVTVVYGSSVSEVCAKPIRASEVECDYSEDGTKVKCCWWTEPEHADDIYRMLCAECARGSDGEWSCSDPAPAKADEDVLPESLQDALDVALGESQNTTKVPETGVLVEPNILSDDEESTENGDDESTENGDGTKVPKGPGGLNNDDGLTINPDLP